MGSDARDDEERRVLLPRVYPSREVSLTASESLLDEDVRSRPRPTSVDAWLL